MKPGKQKSKGARENVTWNRFISNILAENIVFLAQYILFLSPKTHFSGEKVFLFAVEYLISDPEIKVFGWKRFFIRAKSLFFDQKLMILAFETKLFGWEILLFSEK